MKQYHKIPTVFKRNPDTNFKTLLEGCFATPELEYLASCQWVFTEKVDGTNIRVMYNCERITFGGKTDNAQIPVFLVTRLQELFPQSHMFDHSEIFGDASVCLYGEGYGAKIQSGGKYISNGVDFVLFDVRIGDWWLQRKDVNDIGSKLGIQVVPIIGYGTLQEAIESTRKGIQSTWGEFVSEGMVMRPGVELYDRLGRRIIAKIKYNDFPR